MDLTFNSLKALAAGKPDILYPCSPSLKAVLWMTGTPILKHGANVGKKHIKPDLQEGSEIQSLDVQDGRQLS